LSNLAHNLIAEAGERLDRSGARPRISFEFFPPKSEKLETQLWEAIAKLSALEPAFVSVTYGAGGATRDRTHRTVSRIVKETEMAPAAHLTCVGASRDEIDSVLRGYWEAGVRHVVALRGDPPAGIDAKFAPHPEGYANAAELVSGALKIGAFEISVAVHPERHPDSPTWEHELDNFKRKLAAGARRGMSQFFFDADIFLRFRDRVAAAGITAPVVPGIMPVTNFKGQQKMAAGCGASVPAWLTRLFDGLDDDPETRKLVAAAASVELCARLAAEGVEDFHFYTLNRAELTMAICRVIGVHAEEKSA
jgi:methylenetetrahydrofolate reductase (NADPH)